MVAKDKPTLKPIPPAPHDGTRLRALIDRANITQEALAGAVGVTPQGVGRWIKYGEIARENIAAICVTLRCSADELLGLAPIASTNQVAEARAIYRLLDEDARLMLSAYNSASPEQQRALRTLGGVNADSPPLHKKAS